LHDLGGQQPAQNVALRKLEHDPADRGELSPISATPHRADLQRILFDRQPVGKGDIAASARRHSIDLGVLHERSRRHFEAESAAQRDVDELCHLSRRRTVGHSIHEQGARPRRERIDIVRPHIVKPGEMALVPPSGLEPLELP
jgi:hypothetical protein